MNVELLASTPNPEHVIELAARTCYQSADKAGADTAPSFLPKLIKMGHESPFEHAYATFKISGCSRAMTHQLVEYEAAGMDGVVAKPVDCASLLQAIERALAGGDPKQIAAA